MLVTEIRKNIRYKKLNEIYLDYDYAFSLYDSEMKKFGVLDGAEIDVETVDEKIMPQIKKNALNDALRIIARVTSTKKTVSDKLKMKKYPGEAIDSAIDYLEKRGYIDDYDYAESLVKSLIAKGKGRKYIEFELLKKGIDTDVAGNLISSIFSFEEVKKACEKKLKSVLGTKSSPDFKDINKVKDYLLRQGFTYDEISEALSYVKGDYEY